LRNSIASFTTPRRSIRIYGGTVSVSHARRRPLVRRAAALLVIAGCSGSRAAPPPNCPPSPFRNEPPLVIAHAGGEGLGPANTIIAMRRSMAAGADVLDVDLWMSSDGVVVARHDRDLSTTTDGTGFVDARTWAELQELDAAATWTGDPVDEAVHIPSLADILDAFPDVLISLEIKQVEPSMAESLCADLLAANALDRVYVSSNTDAALLAARDACPGMLITTTYADLDARRAADARGEPWCAAAPIGQPPYREDRFDASSVADSHAHGQAIFTWTVDDRETLRELAEVGVDGVYTRRPDIARAVFDELVDDAREAP
jgi:glycerophosphoryl diester phosphodiesterase